ncbi:sensor domain-containing diguanylate cyclase [Fuerstiella marisgermanici]|uniref:diguanylate cyclase n=1 Tax=Fuerstiella marisgermanici TaxID=1891926 RepID=A0A1P8WJ81_9PLAN|nr:GGDEF domain-containing protein [Fuerstiella marisgermanici]APZ94115.1 Diguanylate cyclase DosC [Fuerstiella marisgermanici]
MLKSTKKLSRLPTLPTIAMEILRVFGDPDAPIQRISELVQTDPALASKILKAANSSRFGLPREVADVRQAITLMGKAKITPLVLGFSLVSESVADGEQGELFKKFWLRSFVRATAAEVLGSVHGAAIAAECFTLNLLAGIGQLGMMKQAPEDYIECMKRVQAGDVSISEAERSAFGLTHLELSSKMLTDSGMPKRFVEAIQALAEPEKSNNLTVESSRLYEILTTAAAFARYLCDHDRGVALVVLKEQLDNRAADSNSMDELTTAVRTKLQNSAALFDIDTSVIPEPEALLNEALEQLSEFTETMNDASEPSIPAELVAENGWLKQQVQSLVIQTSTDALTGVANRSYFDRRLDEMNKHCLRSGIIYGVAVVDIDHFKEVNDTYGHQAGDEVLKCVADCLRNATRSNETLARYGGEEFVVLLDNIPEQGMYICGERLRTAVEAMKFEFNGTPIPITVSIGLANGLPSGESFGETLFGLADAALYQAKQSGRNCVVVDYFSQSGGRPTRNSTCALRSAATISDDEVVPTYSYSSPSIELEP